MQPAHDRQAAAGDPCRSARQLAAKPVERRDATFACIVQASCQLAAAVIASIAGLDDPKLMRGNVTIDDGRNAFISSRSAPRILAEGAGTLENRAARPPEEPRA